MSHLVNFCKFVRYKLNVNNDEESWIRIASPLGVATMFLCIIHIAVISILGKEWTTFEYMIMCVTVLLVGGHISLYVLVHRYAYRRYLRKDIKIALLSFNKVLPPSDAPYEHKDILSTILKQLNTFKSIEIEPSHSIYSKTIVTLGGVHPLSEIDLNKMEYTLSAFDMAFGIYDIHKDSCMLISFSNYNFKHNSNKLVFDTWVCGNKVVSNIIRRRLTELHEADNDWMSGVSIDTDAKSGDPNKCNTYLKFSTAESICAIYGMDWLR